MCTSTGESLFGAFFFWELLLYLFKYRSNKIPEPFIEFPGTGDWGFDILRGFRGKWAEFEYDGYLAR